jgi:hypothetical protein
MRRVALTATLLSLALVGGAAAQATNPVSGAAAGATAGAQQGAAVAGPIGAVVGAPLGAAAGAVAGTVGAAGTAAGAVTGGPLVVNVTPGSAPAAVGVPPGVGRTVVINGVVYDRVPARVLFTTGPRYTERSGARVRRGSVIPEWVDAAPMRNVSIRRLRSGNPYGYFVSPDNKVVVFEPGSRRVARVISRAG